MKNLYKLFSFLILVISGYSAFGQYSISGYLDTPEKNKRVYLSILKFNELNTISKEQILSVTKTDSTGYFNFEGQLLSDKHALYRIYSQTNEEFEGTQMVNNEKLKSFHNFVFSNKDTIVFEKNSHHWFGSNFNTNLVDKEWKAFGQFSEKLRLEFSSISNSKVRKQSASRYLWELKTYVKNKEPHPLSTLILLSELPLDVLKKDLITDSKFYTEFENKLNNYYEGTGYAQQYKDLLIDLSKNETQEQLDYFKRFTYVLAGICTFLSIFLILLFFKFRRMKRYNFREVQVNFTSQEERVAELIVENKSNKEIANELFISLNTVKTHIRNLYAKLEVSNRQEFIDTYKNHPRD